MNKDIFNKTEYNNLIKGCIAQSLFSIKALERVLFCISKPTHQCIVATRLRKGFWWVGLVD